MLAQPDQTEQLQKTHFSIDIGDYNMPLLPLSIHLFCIMFAFSNPSASFLSWFPFPKVITSAPLPFPPHYISHFVFPSHFIYLPTKTLEPDNHLSSSLTFSFRPISSTFFTSFTNYCFLIHSWSSRDMVDPTSSATHWSSHYFCWSALFSIFSSNVYECVVSMEWH